MGRTNLTIERRRGVSRKLKLSRALVRLGHSLRKYCAAVPNVKTLGPKSLDTKSSRQATKSDMHQDKLAATSVLSVNSFLYAAELLSHHENVRLGRRDEGEAVEVHYIMPNPSTSFQKAGDAGLFKPDADGGFERNMVMAIAAAIYARYHFRDQSTLAHYIFPSRISKVPGLKAEILRVIKKKDAKFQHGIMEIYLVDVHAIVEQMSGMSVWETSTEETRLDVFGRVFDDASMDVAIAGLRGVAYAVSLRDIFSDSTDEHLLWQKFHRMVFIQTCEKVYTLRIAAPKDKRMQVFEWWKIMIAGALFKEMGLGEMDDIPITLGSLDSRRTRIPRTTERPIS